MRTMGHGFRAAFMAVGLGVAALAAGCGSCNEEPAKAPPMEQLKVTLLSAPLDGLKAPQDAIAYGGGAPLAATLSRLGEMAAQAGLPLPDPTAQLSLALKAELALKDEKVVDLTRGVRFALFNPKVFAAAPAALIVGIKSKDALVAALPDEKKAGDEGNAYSYLRFPGSTEAIYVNFTSDWAIVTRDKTIFPRYREFLELLAFSSLDDAAGAVVAVRNLQALYGAELEAGLADLRKSVRATLGAVPGAAEQAWIVDAVAHGLAAGAKGLDTVRVKLDTLSDGLRLEVSLHPKAGDELAQTFSGLRGPGKGAVLARLPADAPFFMYANVAPERLTALSQKIADMTVGAMLKSDPAKQAEYNQAMMDAVGAFGGEFGAAAHTPVGGDGLTLTTLFNLRDPAKAQAAQAKLTAVYKEPGAVEYYKRVGLQVEMQPNAYQVGGTPVSTIVTRVGEANAQLKAMSAGLAELLTQHIALGKDGGVLAYGTDARKTVEAALGGTLPGGLDQTPGVARALKNAAPNPFALLYVSPVDAARRVRMSGLNPLAPMLKDLSGTTGIALSLGGEGGALSFTLDLPVEQMRLLGQAVQKFKGGGL